MLASCPGGVPVRGLSRAETLLPVASHCPPGTPEKALPAVLLAFLFPVSPSIVCVRGFEKTANPVVRKPFSESAGLWVTGRPGDQL